jgi:hypothetical protein
MQSFLHREIGEVNLKKKIEDGYSQIISSTLDNNITHFISAGPSHAIHRFIKGGGHGIIFNAYRGHRSKRLISGGLSP